jgi:hypothetical protein
LDRPEIDLDRTGPDTSQADQAHQFKAQQEDPAAGDGDLSQDSNNRGVSGGAGGAQFGQGANTPGRENIDQEQRIEGVRGDDSVTEKKIQALIGEKILKENPPQ